MAILRVGVALHLIVVCLGSTSFSVSGDTELLVGQNLSLSCAYPEAVSLWWEKVGGSLPSGAVQTSHGSNSSQLLLVVLDVTEQDGGQYVCRANTSGGQVVDSEAVSVTVFGPPTVCNVMRNDASLGADPNLPEATYTVYTGDKVVFDCCNVGSEFLSTVSWKNGDDDFVVASDSILLQGSTLTFANIGHDDARRYKCVVGGGLAESEEVLLKVAFPNDPLAVSASSSVVCASPGGNATLSCTVTGPYRSFGWVLNGNSVGISDFQLLITNVQKSNAGEYRCRATAEEDDAIPAYVEAMITLDLTCVDKVTVETESNTIGIGKSYSLECSWEVAEGASPELSVSWTTPLLDASRTSYSGDLNEILHVSDAELSDSGTYECTVAGPTITSISSSVSILIEAAPKISITPSSPMAKKNHSLLLQCSSNSSRVPTFTWRKGTVEINSDSLFSITSDGSVSSLYIDVFNESFLGEYWCMAIDEVHGLGQTSVEVQLSTEIYLLRPLKNQTEFDGNPLEVECAVEGGVDKLTIEWRKGDVVLLPSPGVTVCTEPSPSCGPHPSLKLDKLSVSDEGMYSCVVHDSQKSKTFFFFILVYIKARFQSVPPDVVTAIEGTDVQFDCVVQGKPLPSIGWSKNLDPILSDAHVKDLGNGSLVITQVNTSDEGQYICLFQKTMTGGVEFAQFELRVEDSSPSESNTPDTILGFPTNTFLVIVLSAVAGFFIIVTLMVIVGLLCFCCRRKSRPSPANKVALETTSFERRPSMRGSMRKDNSGILAQSPSNLSNPWAFNNHRHDNHIAMHSMGSGSMVVSPGPPIPSPVPPGPMGSLVTMETSPAPKDFPHFPRNSIELGEMMGEGEFGPVVRAVARNIVPGEESTPVAVKVLMPHEGEESFQPDLILSDFVNQMKLSSPYIATILGLCTDQEPYHVIYQYLDKGDLKKFLVGNKPSPDQPPLLTQKELLQIVFQVSEGMSYLYSQQIIHGDLATRNCLVSSTLAVKIADLGIGHDLYPNDYYDNGTQLLPIRWMAPELLVESLEGPSFSLASDVWSFGVLCWEVFSYARQPYDELTNAQVLHLVPAGHNLSAPIEGCPPLLFNLMQDCWAPSPMQRPSFSQISSAITSVEFD